MAERRGGTKGRRMGSSRRRQLREGSSEAPTAAPGEEPPWASEMVQKVQDFFREQDKDQEGFVTRSDMKKLQQEDFPCSTEELELIFDGLDAAGTGRLRTEEFTAGLCQFLSSQKAARDHRRRKTASRRLRLVLPSPVVEEAESEKRHFAAFMEQLGTDNISEEKEIWQLWVKLRQDEPQLLGNLEDFLAKMRHRIQEARSKKEALEVTLNKCVAEHDKEVQQLCEALEQQIRQEKQQLEQKSTARSHQHGAELQRALDASEREVQRLVTAQMELETRCRSLRSAQQSTSAENRQLEESNRELEDRLQHLHQQLQQTHGHLQTARASVAWEHVEELTDRAVAELPEETPVSPQMSPAKSEKYRSEMRIRLGSQDSEPKAKSTHQVVWEMPLAARSHLGVVRRTSSTEDDPFPEFLKEEHFSDQSSLLREMNDAIAALSKPLKPQAPGAPLVPADAAPHPRDDAEPQTGLEAATTFAPTSGILQEVLLGHVAHELFEGDLKERPATAHLGAPDMTRAGGSVGAGNPRAQELGGQQGESPKEAWRMLFPQVEGADVKELMLKAAEDPQGAPGESVEAGELMEMKGVGWRQETTGWEKARHPGDVEEVALSQGENSEAGLGPLEAGLAAGWHLVTGELGPAAAWEECAEPQSTGLGEEADPPSGHSEKLAVKPGEHLEPEPPTSGWARMGEAQGDGAFPEVTVDPGPRMLEEEHFGANTLAAIVPAAQHGGSSRAGAEEGEVEVTQPMEAEPQGEFAMGDAAWGGTAGTEVLPVPPTDGQEGGTGTEVQLLGAQSCDVSVRLLAEVEAALQPQSEPGSPGTEQGGSGVQPLEEDDKAGLGPGEGPSPAETPAGGAGVGGLLPVSAQALELVGTEESWTHMQLREDPSPEASLGGGDHAALQLGDEGEDGGRRQRERELPPEPLMDLCEAGFRQGDGAGAEEQPRTKADKCSAGTGDTASLPLVSFQRQRPGVKEDGDVHYPEKEQELELVQREGVNKDELCLVKAQGLELEEAEDSRVGAQLHGDLSPESPRGEESGAAMQLAEEAEGGGQGQGERELLQELDLHGEGAGAGVQPQAEAVILESLEDQSTDASTQMLAEALEIKLTPGGSTEEDLQPSSETGYLGRKQGVGTAADVQPLEQVDKPELVELVEAEDLQVDMQLCGGFSPETLHGGVSGAAVELEEEAEDGAQGQDERGLPQEPVFHPHGVVVRQGEGAPEDVQPWDDAENLDTLEDQSTDANMQLLVEVDELKLTLGCEAEADLQCLSKPGSLDTKQAGSVAPDVQLQGQVDKLELLELVEAEDSWGDTKLHGVASPEILHGWGDHAAVHRVEKTEDEVEGQGECGLPHQPVLDLPGPGVRQGEGDGADVQPREEAVIRDIPVDQSSDADVQPISEVYELQTALGEGVEADLGTLSEAGPMGTEQGGTVAPDVLPLDQIHEPEIVEAEAEYSWVDKQLRGGLSTETLQGAEGPAAIELVEEAENGVEEQRELLQELDLHGEGADAGAQPQEEAVILESVEDQGTDANTQLLAEALELKLTPGGSTEEDLQPLSETGYLGREQRVSMTADVQLQGQMDKPELVELLETEGFHVGMQLCGGQSPETLLEWGDCAAVHLVEEAEDGGPGQDKCGLPEEPVLHPHGLAIRQVEGTPEDVQPWEIITLESVEDQSTDANMQLLAEALELKLTPGGSTEEDLQPLSEAGYPGREQGVGMAADIQPLEQVDKPELVELVEAEDLQVDMQQGDGAGAGVRPWKEAVTLDTLEDQGSDANMQPLTEAEELKSTLGGRAEADLPILAAAEMQKGEQSQTPSSEAGLCAAHTVDGLEGAAGASVSSPGEAVTHPACAAAPEGPGLDTKLGALPSPDSQILGDTWTLELRQGEESLDGAQGLKVVQGERLEAGVRSFLETQGLGLKQDHGDTASALAPPVSEVALQTSTRKLGTMMQEDVLVPDVRRLGSSGQAAQSQLQEQVPAQADKVRLGAASQWPEEKPPRVMETEQAAVRPAEPPKQEVLPASTLHTVLQQEEDAGNDQLGMVPGDSSLGDAANSSTQPRRQLLRGESKDLSVGQREKKREAGQKTSQEGNPSPGTVTADGAGAAPGGSPEAFQEPDHLYNVLFVGDSHVGKTSFLYRLHADTFNPHLTATVGLDYQVKNLVVDNKCFALRLWDSAGQERYHSITRQFFRKADGVVLMYDITSEYSFLDVQYWLSCIQEGAEDGVAILLLGNKTDCAAERRVPTKEGEHLAKEHRLLFYECSAASGHNVSESMVSLTRMLKVHEDELKKKAEEVPEPSQKKKGCCW